MAKCGCVAVSPKRLPDIQHMFCVWQVKWSRENYYHNLSSPYCLRLASGDASGKIIVWDVVSGTAHCEIQEHSKPIQGKRFFRNSPTPTWPPFIVGSDWFFVHLHYARGGTLPCQHCQGGTLNCCWPFVFIKMLWPLFSVSPPGAHYASILFISTFSSLSCSLSLSDLEWLWNQDASRDLLLAVHPPNYIVLWNGDTGTKLWKKSYAENILSFSFDPFDPSNMACRWTTSDSALVYLVFCFFLTFSPTYTRLGCILEPVYNSSSSVCNQIQYSA